MRTAAAYTFDVLLAALRAAARNFLEAFMTSTYRYQSDFARRHFFEGKAAGIAEGKAEGKAKAGTRGLGCTGRPGSSQS